MSYHRIITAYERGVAQGRKEAFMEARNDAVSQAEVDVLIKNARNRGYKEGYEDALESVRRFVDEQ